MKYNLSSAVTNLLAFPPQSLLSPGDRRFLRALYVRFFALKSRVVLRLSDHTPTVLPRFRSASDKLVLGCINERLRLALVYAVAR